MRRDIIRHYSRHGLALLPGLLAGCAILLAIFARWLLLRLKVSLVLPILVYPSLAALFTFLIWLVFFS